MTEYSNRCTSCEKEIPIGDAKVFDDSVKASLHDFTGGVPRQINNLATTCLLQATARNVARIDDALFQQAVSEFQLP